MKFFALLLPDADSLLWGLMFFVARREGTLNLLAFTTDAATKTSQFYDWTIGSLPFTPSTSPCYSSFNWCGWKFLFLFVLARKCNTLAVTPMGDYLRRFSLST